jgi:signal transduction histidine kinase
MQMDVTSEAATGPQAALTVGELPLWHMSFDRHTRTGEIEQCFLADRDLPACIISADGKLFGSLSRRHLMAELSKPMGREVFIKRPVEIMTAAIDPNPLVLPAATTVAAAVEAALSRPDDRSFEPVIIDAGDTAGILSVDVLMRVQSSQLEHALIAKDELLDEVQRSADDLRAALEKLGQARDRLVQSEKMAALGQLVAGVAHEINTPIGVALTATTHLNERTGEFRQSFLENRMKRSDLQAYIDLATESSELLRYNIQRASQLIQSFKQVAVDQTSEQHRRFDLKAYLEQLAASLAPEVRKAGHSLVVNCEPDILVLSYPGPLAQVLSNLVSNAILHAYERGDSGTITLSCAANGSDLVLTVADHGRGISPENLSHIYDPFFTTRRGSGGTGLGLNIVFNIVTDTLKGRIDCQSELGAGTVFTVTMPLQLPQ